MQTGGRAGVQRCYSLRRGHATMHTSRGAGRAKPSRAVPGPPRRRAVISAYFEEKGLVRQQLDSFNDFINTSLQEIVDENNLVTITPQNQHNPGMALDDEEQKEYQVGRRAAGAGWGLAGQPRTATTWRARLRWGQMQLEGWPAGRLLTAAGSAKEAALNDA